MLTKDELPGELNFEFQACYPLTVGSHTWGLRELNDASDFISAKPILGVPMSTFRRWEIARRDTGTESSSFASPTLALMIRRWMKSIASFYTGVTECMICYCVVHATTSQLPKKGCPTCKQLFHTRCLAKWFETSSKTVCPLCKQPF